jgi:hypothetical protein
MSPVVPSGEPRDCGRDVGAYLLGALEPAELEEFQRHLEGCAACRDEIAAVEPVIDVLAMGAPQLAAPRALRRRVLAEVRATPPAGSGAGRARRGPSRRVPLTRGALAGAIALAAAAAIAVGVLVAGGSEAQRSVQAHVAYPSASAVVRVQGGRAELIVQHMPAAPRGKIYEVWLKRDGQAPAATSALFGVTSAGGATVAVPGPLHGVREVLVTPERLGGSTRPTHAPVIIARLA